MKTLEQVMSEQPFLCDYGFAHRHRDESIEDFTARIQDGRRILAQAGAEIAQAVEWITNNLEPAQKINEDVNSYGLKHYAEKEIGSYISNGVFIAAAMMCGYQWLRSAPDSPNAHINISKKLVKALRKTYYGK